MEAVRNYFEIQAKGSSIRTELLAGFATFLTMAYIAVVNPSILSQAKMDFGAVFVATILAAAVGTLIMGLWAKWPVAMAPGMGLNAFFAFGVVLGMGQTWQVALGAVFIAGILFVILSLTGLREWIINSIPKSLKLGIGAGIGFFLAIIGLRNAGVVVDSQATLVTLGNLGSATVLLAGLGFVGMVVLDRLKVPGAIVLSILVVSIIAWVAGISEFKGVVGPVPSIAPTFLQLDIAGAFSAALIGVVFAFLFVDFFDTAGTLTSVANVAGKIGPDGKIEGIGKAVISDSVADRGRRPVRHVQYHQLHRKRRRHQRGWAYRPHGCDRRRPVPPLPRLRTAGPEHSGLCDGAGLGLRRYIFCQESRRYRLGRRDRVRAGGPGRGADAADLLNRQRYRHRLRILRGDQDPERPVQRAQLGRDPGCPARRRQLRV